MTKAQLNILGSVLIFGLLAALSGKLIYMNLRSADPILAGWEDYSALQFNARAANGEKQLVEIYASWCPTCLAQHQAFEDMIADGQAPNIRAIRVDFDRDQDFITKYAIRGTGLLMVFDGQRLIASAAGLVTRQDITAFLRQQAVVVPPAVERANSQP